MDRPGVAFARAPDGTYLAYQAFGDGPLDIVWQDDVFCIVDEWWDDRFNRAFYGGMAEFARVILHDRRGIGCSSREGGPANLETRVSDTLVVMDAAGAQQPVVGGFLEGGASMVLLAATHPERVRSLVWFRPVPRPGAAPDYPWGVGPDYIERDRAMTKGLGHRGILACLHGPECRRHGGCLVDGSLRRHLARLSRRTCTPDVAERLNEIWYETDIRGALPSVQVPTLLVVDREGGDLDLANIGGQVAELMPTATVEPYEPVNLDLAGVSVGLEQIRAFAGLERRPDDLDSVLATVLFTDIVDSTKRSAELGDHGWSAVRHRHDDLVRRELERHRGRAIKTMGDGFLATFEGPARAVHCARAIGEGVRELGIEIRAGLHTGEVELDGDDISGIAVSIGARIAALAGPSEVLVSRTVKDLTAGSGLAFADAGEHELKGVPDRWQLYRVVT